MPHSDRIDATSSCSASFNGHMMPGIREANMVLPLPGGPVMMRLCPPAAATCSAHLACS
mgnify:CR=1 FL=1